MFFLTFPCCIKVQIERQADTYSFLFRVLDVVCDCNESDLSHCFPSDLQLEHVSRPSVRQDSDYWLTDERWRPMLNHAAADESKLSTTLSLPSFRLLNDGKYIESENRMEGWVNMAQFYIVVPIVPSLSMASMVQCQYSFQHKTQWLTHNSHQNYYRLYLHVSADCSLGDIHESGG